MASIVACPPPVAEFTGKIELHANGNAVAIYRDPVTGTEYIRVAPAASVDLAAARWFRVVPEPAAPIIAAVGIAAAGSDPDFGDPIPAWAGGPDPTGQVEADRDAEHLRLMRETVRTLEGEFADAREHLCYDLQGHIMKTITWLYRRLAELCRECGCRRLIEVSVRSYTGVRAPDGTRESGEGTATICERCGTVVGGGVA